MKYYAVLFFDRDMIKHSELIGMYSEIDKAINVLVEMAGYREDNDNNLTQYMKPCDDYASMKDLIEYVRFNKYLDDYDRYVITEYDIF